jgi:hypothetical protein
MHTSKRNKQEWNKEMKDRNIKKGTEERRNSEGRNIQLPSWFMSRAQLFCKEYHTFIE